MAFTRSMARKRVNARGTLATLVWVPLSVGCATLEEPWGPDFTLDQTPLPQAAVERLEPEDLPAPETDVSPFSADGVADASVIPENGGDPTSIYTGCRAIAVRVLSAVQPDGSTLSDAGPLDIEHVEIVKEASAAVLNGLPAQNSMIESPTKHGTLAGRSEER